MIQQKTAIINAYQIDNLKVPEHKLAFLDCNEKASNVVVCVHGLISNSHDFDYLALELSKDFRIISIDMPGRGDSDWFEDKSLYQYSVYIAEILALLKSLNITSVDWVGTSMGGIIGMIIAADHPGVVKTMILNDIGPEIPGRALAKIRKYIGIAPIFPEFASAKKHLQMIYKNFGVNDDEHWNHLVKYTTSIGEDGGYRLKYDPQIAETFVVDMDNPKDVVFWDLWDKITCDILLIHGIKSDILLQTTIDKMQERSNLSTYKIEEAGHAPALVEQKEICHIHQWLLSR